MENRGFQDSDHSMHESSLGICRPAAMHRPRRPHHLATFQHPHTHNAVITHTHGHAHVPELHGLPVTTHSNTITHAHLSSHGIPATAHLHGGRVVGVTGVPSSAHSTPAGTPTSFPATPTQPLYSCQAPRGHDHVYQCPGLRGDPVDHHHNNDGNRIPSVDPRYEHYLEHRDSTVVEVRERQVGSTGPDQRTEYHYGGSDYSSTEPIYAQPHLNPHEAGQGSPAHTPPLTYTTMRGSLRTSSTHIHGTPARFLVRTDSTGASTSSSTLPTVSALMAMDPAHAHARARAHTHEFSKVASISSTPSTPAKLKGSGVLGAWRAKYLEGSGGSRRAALLLGLLVLLLILVLGGLAAVLYLTLGGGFGAIVGQPPQLVHLTEKGSSIVSGQFRITNQNYWHGLSDVTSESFRILSKSIEKEMDHLFLNSVWAREFNRSEVVSLSDGSLVVRTKLHLNTPDTSAAKNLGSAFLRGLHKRYSQEWLGPYTIDITSIRFAEVLVDSTAPISSSPTPLSQSTLTTSGYTRTFMREDATKRPARRPNVGWGEWGPWSSCSPCSPQYDQIRTRKCRLDRGKGILVSNIELCLPEGHAGHLQGSRGNMESRPCQCHNAVPDEKDEEYVDRIEEELENTTEYSLRKTSSTSKLRGKNKERETEENIEEYTYKTGICDTCRPGQVCVALVGESFPTCRSEKNSADPTGCGGLCLKDIEVCQALGSRAFECHSASHCLDDEWRCADGLCIPQAKRCDGHLNCYDRSDEYMCKCNSDEFHCGNKTSCLPLTAKCDGNVNCWDGLDEANCTDAVIASKRGASATDSQTAGTALMNPLAVPGSADILSSNAGMGDVSHLPPSVTGVTRVATSVMNRTAIGLSSLSHRERELLS